MSDRLAKLEARIEKFVEGTLARLLAGRLQAREVAVRLARAMEDHAQPGPRDTRVAPVQYRVRVNPDDAAAIQANTPDLAGSLAAELITFARELGLSLPGQPEIAFEPDPAIEPSGLAVEAVTTTSSQTRPMQVPPGVNSSNPAKAYLILNGDRHIPLDRPVITLGRRLDNTIIVDNPHVSRHHAQLRQRYGRWVLYDLGSASGTYVNKHRIEESMLQPGDVITMADATLIYGEEDSGNSDEDTGGTLPLPARAEPPPSPRDE